ncbi:BURP domain protein RD22 [Quillaja saponaria]|uniref:BURP domain protein RD22 n=1 Tax=Quillaja saponaria TaxID=32244 RepID=A0AAD7PK58_QUISA|nr:BURP domain protein RD22 [Quillaja saponaria]
MVSLLSVLLLSSSSYLVQLQFFNMEYCLLPIFTFLTLALMATHAALPPELYWKSKLPNTPIPKAISDLLNTADLIEEKSTPVSVGEGGVNVNAGKGKPGNTAVNVGKGGVNVNAGKGKPGNTGVTVGKGGVNVNTGGGTHVSVGGKGGLGVNTGKHGPGTNIGVGKGGVSVGTGHKGKPVYVRVKPGTSPFLYKYAATETQLHDNRNVALFFLEKDLHPGTNMPLHFTKSSNPINLLPRNAADSIPFSSNKLTEILDRFSVKSGSMEEEVMKNTIKACEEPASKGEEKYCATSLESMVDFSTSKLGKNVEAISTEVGKETQLQKYTIAAGVKKMAGKKSIVCHKQSYAYAVFYCHKTETTRAYKVPLVGADGTKTEAVAICHTDTSEWNPKHLAFQVLKVKPGTVPVCHFLPDDHVVWVPK